MNEWVDASKHRASDLWEATHIRLLQLGKWAMAGARRVPRWMWLAGTGLLIVLVLVLLIRAELRTSWLQSTWLSSYAAGLTHQVEPGPSSSIVFPNTGPYNVRLGYTAFPAIIDSLTIRNRFAIAEQARASDTLASHMKRGLSPPYVPKQQSGLDVLDQHSTPLFSARYPRRVYTDPDSSPRPGRETLLFIENRALLDTEQPRKNPAIEWNRFSRATAHQLTDAIGLTEGGPGGSTLATQLDKVRHAPGGLTTGPTEKLRQMASASVQSYLDGPYTTAHRQRLVAEYLNLLPLAAIAGHGEVNGLGDGLWAWYNTDLDSVNVLLSDPTIDTEPTEAQAQAYRQVLHLVLSTRSPTRFLTSQAGHDALHTLADVHLPLLAEAGIISPELRDATLAVEVERRSRAVDSPEESFVARKAATATRVELLQQLGLLSLSTLDRFDLSVHTHYDAEAQRAAAELLEQLKDPAFVRSQGLMARNLLDRGDPALVEYAMVLYERDSTANVVRLQADTFEGPFDLNRGSTLELGSTAKLRTLVTYLELMEELQTAYAGQPADSLRAVSVAPNDALTAWALQELRRTPNVSRVDFLQAAMNRRYSASPYERFFTGGGQHRFSNFSTQSDSLRPTVTTAFRHSINLPFIRMMRDIVNYHIARLPGQPGDMLVDASDERRAEYLARFADQEGREFLRRFYNAYPTSPNRDVFTTLGERHTRLSAQRLAWAYRSIDPDADPETIVAFLQRYASDAGALTDAQLITRINRADAETFSWQDRGYLAGIHPLELWLANYLHTHPEATRAEIFEASADVRQEVYQWLFQRRPAGQDSRIRTILEQEAFVQIHERWARVGYPFERLIPTYATAIGSSADQPEALTELVGILLRDGVRYPTERIHTLHLGADTPFETRLASTPAAPDTVLSPEVAAATREAMIDVVERGTAVRARGAVLDGEDNALPIGAKTGTGNNRIRTAQRNVPLNRTSTLVFFIDDRFFGTLTAYAPGEASDTYRFTSSLPSQILTMMGPSLASLVDPPTDPTLQALSLDDRAIRSTAFRHIP